MVSGTRLSINHFCNTACNVENIGKAVNTASATVKNGTSAMVVVKVRLLAVKGRWSLANRSRKVSAVLFHGNWVRVNGSDDSADRFIVGMMPSQ